MLEDSNILLFLIGVIPGLLYAFIIYLNSPMKTIKLKPSTFYLLFGMSSVFLVMLVHFIFPHYLDHIDVIPISTIGVKGGVEWRPTVLSMINMTFVQIGLTEELSKAVIFFIATFYRQKTKVDEDHPFAIMFYVCMVSLGFALVENVDYIWRAFQTTQISTIANVSPEIVGVRRMVSAILAHMSFGLVMGYFFALTKKPLHGNSIDITVFNVWSKHRTKIRNGLLIFGGIVISTLLHGLYDFNLSIGTKLDEFVVPIKDGHYLFHMPSLKLVVSTLVITFFMGKNLMKIDFKKTEK
jgi:RsiW-degrading membrane proteinase PrsW (M82 family)